MSSVSIAAALTFDTVDYAAIVGVNLDPIKKGQTVNCSIIEGNGEGLMQVISIQHAISSYNAYRIQFKAVA